MKYKKIMLILITAIFLASIAGVSASDAEDAIAISEDAEAMEVAQSDEMTASDDSNAMEQSDDEELILEDNDVDKPILGEKASTGSFTDLNDLINNQYYSNDTITLSCNYTFNGTDDDDSGFIHGISINRGVTIDGKGCTIDGSQKARIFNIGNGGAVKFLNINFINGKATGSGWEMHGGAISAEYSNCVVECCNFTNNTADIHGGALVRVTAYNCTFTGNTAYQGGAILQGSAYNCVFTGNTAVTYGGAIDFGSAYNCTFTGNTVYGGGGAMCGDSLQLERFNATLCMFDSNSPDDYRYIRIVNVVLSADDLTTSYKSGDRLLFNLTADNTNYVGFNTTIKIYQDGQEMGTYYALSGEGWVVDLSPGTYKAVLSLDKYVGVTQGVATITVMPNNTFWALNQKINGNDKNEINLTNDYYYDPAYDSAFTQGIMINRPVTINGNGYTINATGKARIFKVTSNDVTLNNITFTEGNTTGNGGAIYWSSSNANILNCCFVNNTANGYGGANYFYNAVTNVNLTGNFTNNRAEVSGGANCFRLAVTNVALTGNFTNNRANVYDGGANYFFDAVTDVILTGDFNNNTAIRFGGANCFWGEVTNVNLTCDFNNNRAETESGGANFFVDAVTNVALTGDFNNNSAKTQGGANCFDKAVTNVTLTGNYINNTGKNVIYIGNSVSGNVIRDSIFINNAPINVTKGNISVIDNWFGNNVTDYDVKPEVGIDLDNWLFLNATADYNVIPVFNSSSIVFKLYLYNSTAEEKKASEYDNALLMPINLTITSANGDVDSSVANFGESIRYTATHAGDGSVTATLGTAEFTIKLNNIKADSNLSVENQVIIFGENATVALNYNSNATGKVNITLTGKKGTFTYQNLDLNATIVLSNDVPADEYYVTVLYSGDVNFFNATANATLTVNKANSTLTINGNITFDYNTNGSATVSFSNATGVNAIVVGQPMAIVNVVNNIITVSGLDTGNYTLSVTTITDGNYNNVTKTTAITVNKAKTELIADAIVTIYNANKDLVITLKDSNGNPISGLNITVDLNGAKNYTTDTSGQVKISTKGLAANIYDVMISFNGTDKYLNCSNTTTVSIYKESSRVDTKPLTTDYNVHKYLVVGLKDNEGNPIRNADAYIEIHGVTYKCRSDDAGNAKLIIRLNPGTYTAKITFDNVNYTGFTQYVTVIVKKLTPKLTVKKKTFKKSKKVKKYTVTLKANSKALAKVKLTLKVKGKTYKAKTNAKGKAVFKIKNLKKKGKYRATVRFAGNTYYNKVTKKVKITVK